MAENININVHHITRVEGHGNIVVNVREGKIEELKLEITESPRFFEAFLRGRHISEAPHITSRICGICGVGHTLASIEAAEAAVGITPSEQTVLLRKLLNHGETIQSHVLHFYFLAAPDLFKAGSVFPLASSHPDVVHRALRMKKLANDLCIVTGGRQVHPISAIIGGFTRIPTEAELKDMRERLVEARADVDATVDLFAANPFPEFERETEFLALRSDDEYAFLYGKIVSTDGVEVDVPEYKKAVKEKVVDHSTAKHASSSRDSYMVGALARVSNNYDKLHPRAKEAAEKLGLKLPCYNPFMNNAAQVVEVAHCVEDSIRIIDELLSRGLKDEKPIPIEEGKPGQGVGAVEVPRGTLYHDYTVDEKGYLTDINCIIPTAQNLANIEADMYKMVPEVLDKSEEEITFLLEMLVRAYDPCISCSAHILTVKFVK